MKRYLPFIIIGGVLVVAILAVGLSLVIWRVSGTASKSVSVAANPSPATNSSYSVQQTKTAAPSPAASAAPGAEPAHIRGDQAAPVTLEEFGDFQCPPCGALYPDLKKIEAEFGPRLRVVFREFPLARIHKNALDAARAAESAGLQGRFWEMHDLLYEKQNEWSVMPDARPVFQEFARVLKLDVERFKSDMDTLQLNSRISSDMQRGDSLGVKGTPTLFLNGRELAPADMTLEGLRAAINSASKEKGR